MNGWPHTQGHHVSESTINNLVFRLTHAGGGLTSGRLADRGVHHSRQGEGAKKGRTQHPRSRLPCQCLYDLPALQYLQPTFNPRLVRTYQ